MSAGAKKTDGGSTFYTDALTFEDNFNPVINDQQTGGPPQTNSNEKTHGGPTQTNSNEKTHGGTPQTNSNEKTHGGTLQINSDEKPTTTSSAASKSNSTPLNFAQASPLTCYALRLKHGEELRKTLLNFIEKHELKAAFILSCVGSALSAKLRLASAVSNTEGNYMIDMTNLTEIVSLQGTLSNGGHLHAALADVTGKVIGGHLLELIVDTTAEVVIGECTALSFTRTFDQTTGFNELEVNSR